MPSPWFSFSALLADHPVALWLAALATGAALCGLLMLVLRLARARLDRLARPPPARGSPARRRASCCAPTG